MESINLLGNRSAVICRKVLEVICYGDEVISPTLTVDDKNRKQYYDLLMALYSAEAAKILEISKSTFLRRYRDYKNMRQ